MNSGEARQDTVGDRVRPFTRWWWLRGPFRREGIERQLQWLKDNGFGGVEVAWIRPRWYSSERIETGLAWLGDEWTELVAFTKRTATELRLGCDFTFGSCWPFGGDCVSPKHAVQNFDGVPTQLLRSSWDKGDRPFALNHLSREAFDSYAAALLPAFAPALEGTPSALFCDSLELDTEAMWSPELWDRFREQFGYELRPYARDLGEHSDVRYDYRKFISETMYREFFEPFAAMCRQNHALSRVQCHGTPGDLLPAYATVDIPESESLLFDPQFSRIPASAAALAGKNIVSAESFTCLYGFPTRDITSARYWKREQVADMKLLADAIFAHGVNHIIWHGMPYNEAGGKNEFYAFVHVDPNCCFANELAAFNRYLTEVSAILQTGQTYSNLAVYLPNEDRWMLDVLPPEKQTPGAMYEWEMRDVVPPAGTEPYHPLWISLPFLRQARVVDGVMQVGTMRFEALVIDCNWLDSEALDELLRLATAGLTIAILHEPQEPGFKKRSDYAARLQRLIEQPSVVREVGALKLRPLVTSTQTLPFWARETDEAVYIFFAHPSTKHVHYPMQYGQSRYAGETEYLATISWRQVQREVALKFDRYQSLLLRLDQAGNSSFIDIRYDPPEAVA